MSMSNLYEVPTGPRGNAVTFAKLEYSHRVPHAGEICPNKSAHIDFLIERRKRLQQAASEPAVVLTVEPEPTVDASASMPGTHPAAVESPVLLSNVKFCVVCDRPILGDRYINVKTCSDKCAHERKKARQRAWDAKNGRRK